MKTVVPSESTARSLRSMLKELNSAHAEILASNRQLAELEKQETKLEAEIAKIESDGDANDGQLMGSLAEKQNALRLTKSRLQALPQINLYRDEVGDLLRRAERLAADALRPTYQALVDEIAGHIRPSCLSDANAKGHAAELPAPAALAGYCFRKLDFSPQYVALKAAIARFEEILSGELGFKFDANRLEKMASANS